MFINIPFFEIYIYIVNLKYFNYLIKDILPI